MSDDYLRRIKEERLPALRSRLADLKSGKLRISEAVGSAPLLDSTDKWVDEVEQEIAIYTAILKKVAG